MQTTTLSFANLHNHGELFANMLRARRELFIVHNKWNLPEAMGMEYDQYDTPASRWVVVHDELGRVLAGNRLTPTTTRCGMYSYMIRDAQRGLLETIPADLLYEEAPQADHIWESSRLFVAHDVPASQRRAVHARLILELGHAARSLGATHPPARAPPACSAPAPARARGRACCSAQARAARGCCSAPRRAASVGASAGSASAWGC